MTNASKRKWDSFGDQDPASKRRGANTSSMYNLNRPTNDSASAEYSHLPDASGQSTDSNYLFTPIKPSPARPSVVPGILGALACPEVSLSQPSVLEQTPDSESESDNDPPVEEVDSIEDEHSIGTFCRRALEMLHNAYGTLTIASAEHPSLEGDEQRQVDCECNRMKLYMLLTYPPTANALARLNYSAESKDYYEAYIKRIEEYAARMMESMIKMEEQATRMEAMQGQMGNSLNRIEELVNRVLQHPAFPPSPPPELA